MDLLGLKLSIFVVRLANATLDPSWERVPVSNLAKLTIWRTEWTRYALVAEKLWDLGRQLPGYYGDEGPSALSFQSKEHLKRVAWDKFLNMDMFFVKVCVLDGFVFP